MIKFLPLNFWVYHIVFHEKTKTPFMFPTATLCTVCCPHQVSWQGVTQRITYFFWDNKIVKIKALRARSFGIYSGIRINSGIYSGYSAPGNRIAGMEIQVFRNENSSQTNAYSHYSNFSYSGLIPNERALSDYFKQFKANLLQQWRFPLTLWTLL